MDSLAIFDRMMRNAEAHSREMMGRHPCARMIKIAFERLCDDVEDWRNAEENQDTFCDDFWTDYDDNNREGMGFWTIIYLMDGEIQFLNFDAHRDTGDFDMSWDRVPFETIRIIIRDNLGRIIN